MVTPAQTAELNALMEPLLQEAEFVGKWLRNVYFEETFSPKRLRHLQAQGEYVQGPNWWTLVDRPHFLVHQGEWDTISPKQHDRLVVQWAEEHP